MSLLMGSCYIVLLEAAAAMGGMFIHISFPYFSGGQVGGPCPLDDSWVYSDNKWSQLKSCSAPSHSASFVPLNSQSTDVGILYGGSQSGPRAVSQVVT